MPHPSSTRRLHLSQDVQAHHHATIHFPIVAPIKSSMTPSGNIQIQLINRSTSRPLCSCQFNLPRPSYSYTTLFRFLSMVCFSVFLNSCTIRYNLPNPKKQTLDQIHFCSLFRSERTTSPSNWRRYSILYMLPYQHLISATLLQHPNPFIPPPWISPCY